MLHKDLKVSSRFRQAVSDAIRSSKYSRDGIVSLIYGLTGISISKQTFDQMTAQSKVERRIPAEVVPAICAITGDYTPIKILAEALGLEVVTEDENKELKLIRLIREKERLEREIEKLKRV